jgi:hypothetical protein
MLAAQPLFRHTTLHLSSRAERGNAIVWMKAGHVRFVVVVGIPHCVRYDRVLRLRSGLERSRLLFYVRIRKCLPGNHSFGTPLFTCPPERSEGTLSSGFLANKKRKC